MYKPTEEFNTVNRHDSSSLLKNVTIATTEVLLQLGNARYKETKKFPRRHGKNCGGGVYTQISTFDSFPKKLVLKRCASRYEVENTLMVQKSLFSPKIWALTSSRSCESCGVLSISAHERKDFLMEYCGISTEEIMSHHAQNKTKFKNILDEFLFEIMEHIHTTYNIWHCDVDYHNIFINENYQLKIIDWELAMPFNIALRRIKIQLVLITRTI